MNQNASLVKILLALLISIFALVLVIVFWWFFYPEKTDTAENPLIGTGIQIFPSSGTAGTQTGGNEETESLTAPETPRIYQVSDKPISGYTLVKNKEGWVARYLERETGHLYEASLVEASRQRLSNTTIPRVQEAVFTSSSTLLLRTEENEILKTLYASMGTSSAEEPAPLRLQTLPDNILSLSASGENIFYLLEDPQGGTSGFLVNIPKKTSAKVFSHPLKSWNLRLLGAGRVFLEHKPSAYASGGLFSLTPSSGALTPILLGGAALSGVPDPQLKNLLLSELGQGGLRLFAFNIEKNERLPLPLPTLAEKCAWGNASSTYAYCLVPKGGPAGIYPDDWYSGEVSSEDTLWKIDTETGAPTLLEKFAEQALDGVNPSLTADDSYLLFMDKKTLSLWSLRLKP